MSGLALLGLVLIITAAPVESLVGKQQETYGAFIRPELKITPIKSKTAELFGGALGTVVGRTLYLGLGGYGLVNSISA
ncbi:MAG: hypothetical protein HYV35_03375, partial [Lentisphaerae bacterium]|nr:hypothetical protein [Lentisphaerota bacterium]